MTTDDLTIAEMLDRIDSAWRDFEQSYAGLPDAGLLVHGVVDGWSVRDILAHVAVWDAYALTALPGILETGEHPRYDYQDEPIDTFNARMTREKRGLSLDEVRAELGETHARLLAYLRSVPPDDITVNTPFRERLGADTWDHYPEHAAAIRAWREERA